MCAIVDKQRLSRQELCEQRRTATRARVLEAARSVFVSEGIDAPMPEIARAAGVGVGTVYRHFPSKEELIGALVHERLEWFVHEADAALERPDAWEALVDLVVTSAQRQSADAVLSEALQLASGCAAVGDQIALAGDALERLLARAKEQGTLRQDVDVMDLRCIFVAVRSVLRCPTVDDGAWRRLLGVVLDGLRADAAHPLGDAGTPVEHGPAVPGDAAHPLDEARAPAERGPAVPEAA
jgi:AcrR family transcriptional regulator